MLLKTKKLILINFEPYMKQKELQTYTQSKKLKWDWIDRKNYMIQYT